MSGMFITGEATFESFAVATVAVVAVEMLVALLVLPAVLAWLGDRVEKGRIPFTRPVAEGPPASPVLWSSIVSRVMRRPLLSAGLATALLVALAIPALSMNMVQTGTDDLPQDLPVMQTYDRFTAAFPDKTNASEVVVEADDVRSGATADGDRRAGQAGRGLGRHQRQGRSRLQRRRDRRPASRSRRSATAPTRRRCGRSTRCATCWSRRRSA